LKWCVVLETEPNDVTGSHLLADISIFRVHFSHGIRL